MSLKDALKGWVPIATGDAGSDAAAGQATATARTGNLRIADWFLRSKAAAVIWLVARLWLGYEWLNAGYQKVWGSESAGFWTSGAGVKGFASAGVAGSTAGKGGASYGWWAGLLHNFVLPNASWIAKIVAVSEIAIGVLLILGLFTGAAAAYALFWNLTYMFSGSAGVNPAYALVAVFLILAWRNAGYFGLDRFVLPRLAHVVRGRGGRQGTTVPPVRVGTPVSAAAGAPHATV